MTKYTQAEWAERLARQFALNPLSVLVLCVAFQFFAIPITFQTIAGAMIVLLIWWAIYAVFVTGYMIHKRRIIGLPKDV